MSKEKHLFMIKYSGDTKTLQYLGSDGLPIIQTFNLYLNKCEEFRMKAKKYAKDNLYLKNSILHHNKRGYESSEQSEEQVMLERERHLKHYEEAFHITFFDEESNALYECFTGKSKRIRILREIQYVRNEELSGEFENKKGTWFTRYCILSRFIQSVRKIILLNRLEKVLAVLRTVSPAMIKMAQDEKESGLLGASKKDFQ